MGDLGAWLQPSGEGAHYNAELLNVGNIDDKPPNIIEKAFVKGRDGWIEDPVISKWKTHRSNVSATLQELNQLYEQWTTSPPGPFCPYSDPLWLQTCEVLRDAGFPRFANNLNLPDDIDPSWPFQTKYFEREAVIAKGRRVGDEDASGYVCSWGEGNLYAIRALQQDLRRQRPSQKPLLVSHRMDSGIIDIAAQIFGLEVFRVEGDWAAATDALQGLTRGERPIIFAATWANDRGQSDDFAAISKLARILPFVLHVDASRNFDFVTALSASTRQELGIPRLELVQPCLDELSPCASGEPTVYAATITAAGMNCTDPPPVVILKPRYLGSLFSAKVEYLKGSDNTLCGSRDSIAPLLIYCQQQLFGVDLLQEIYGRCLRLRRRLVGRLRSCNVPATTSPASLDMVVYPLQSELCASRKDLGLVPLDDGGFLLSVQPSVTLGQIDTLANVFCGETPDDDGHTLSVSANLTEYPVPGALLDNLRATVDNWNRSIRHSGGYCLNQATYTALGPVIGQFLPVSIPHAWTRPRGEEILQRRKESFGVNDAEQESFAACFTTGSTMGNRIGIYAALAHCPHAFVYYSTASHYSFKKILGDNDPSSARWTDRRPQFAAVLADELGRMIPEELVRQVAKDRAFCESQGKLYGIILLLSVGTTFIGGYDDVPALRQAVFDAGSVVDYIHVDGALDFGFSPYPARLGPPELLTKTDLPVVQGITLSHHKANGIMVSGEVICYSPDNQQLVTVVFEVEPRVIFETWVFQQMYSPSDIASVSRYCGDNARRLRDGLRNSGLRIRYNETSIITVMERPPAWIVHRFHLAPEGDWVHYITMPHISAEAVDEFVDALTACERRVASALCEMERGLRTLLVGQEVKVVRIRSFESIVFERIFGFYQRVQEENSGSRGEAREILELDEFRDRFAHGAVSFAALDEKYEPVGLFLSDSMLDGRISRQAVVLHHELNRWEYAIQELVEGVLHSLAEPEEVWASLSTDSGL
ncbi:MAG: hypothetical protein Q9219_007462 [cf. Caloplaca sp. 3 TL-2023]